MLLALTLIALPLVACGSSEQDAKDFVGRWRMTSFVTDDGQQPNIENELDMIFYSTGIGEAQIDGQTLYCFDYTVKDGTLHRLISYTNQNHSEVDESYEFGDDRRTLTIYSPADEATIVLEKVADQVLDRVEVKQ
jgi:hypothetical protein